VQEGVIVLSACSCGVVGAMCFICKFVHVFRFVFGLPDESLFSLISFLFSAHLDACLVLNCLLLVHYS